MFPRRLWTQAPRVPGTVTAQSWSTNCLSQQIHGKTRGLYRGANLQFGFPKLEKWQHFFRAYSNYAPRGPPPHYNYPPPNSRTSRLKDLAIGSVLTIIAYLAYNIYGYWQGLKERKAYMRSVIEMFKFLVHSDKLLAEAEADDDGSPESAEKIRSLFKERAMGAARSYIPKSQQGQPVIDLGPLHRLPEDDESHEVQRIKDSDTLVLMSPTRTAEEIKKSKEFREASLKHGPESIALVTCCIMVAVNTFVKDLGVSDLQKALINHRASKFQEIIRRTEFTLNRLHEERRVGMPITVKFFLRDEILSLVYDGDSFILQ